MKKVYKSKVDTWLILLVFGTFLLPMIVLFVNTFSILVLAIFLLCLAFVSSILFSIKYVLEDETLYIKTAYLFTEKIDIKSITEISSTRTLLSAPAASIDRIALKCGRKVVVISPKNKAEFVEDVCKMAKHEIVVKL